MGFLASCTGDRLFLKWQMMACETAFFFYVWKDTIGVFGWEREMRD